MPKKKKSGGGAIKKCFRCGEEIELIRTPHGWTSYDVEGFRPHVCRNEAERTGEKMPKEFLTSRFESNRRRH